VCCSVIQCVVVCCRVLQRGTLWCSVVARACTAVGVGSVSLRAQLWCEVLNVWKFVAACCSVLQRAAALRCDAVSCPVLQCVAVCSVFKCDAVCCRLLQCVAGDLRCKSRPFGVDSCAVTSQTCRQLPKSHTTTTLGRSFPRPCRLTWRRSLSQSTRVLKSLAMSACGSLYICIYIYMYIYVYMYTYIYVYIHILYHIYNIIHMW